MVLNRFQALTNALLFPGMLLAASVWGLDRLLSLGNSCDADPMKRGDREWN